MNGKTWWDKNIDNWKTYIRSYNEGVGFPSRVWFAEFLRNVQKSPVSILDVGCGGGIEYESLRGEDVLMDYTGVDYAETAIEACKEMFPTAKWQVADARNLSDFSSKSQDVVLLRHTLDHIDKWEDALKAAWRVARMYVVVILWIPPEAEVFDEKGDDAYYRAFDLKKLSEWIRNVLNPVEYEVEVITAENVPGREYRRDTALVMRKYKD